MSIKSYSHLVKDGWFKENETLWPGQAMSLEVEKVLFDGFSDYQHVLVFESKTYGTVLVLDGVIQITDRDEFSYQEMITHLPLFAHPNPKSVIVIGGGDGGVLRQLVRHKSLEKITLCDIDGLVIEKGKEYFPQFREGWEDPRVEVKVGDGLAYLEQSKLKADVIIVDSSDPVGPAETLFSQAFYQAMCNSLNEGGIVCTQAECIWLHLDIIRKCVQKNRKIFKNVSYAYTTIPSYPSGQIGFLLCSDVQTCSAPARTVADAMTEEAADGLRYYSEELHKAAFVLPKFAQDHIYSEKN